MGKSCNGDRSLYERFLFVTFVMLSRFKVDRYCGNMSSCSATSSFKRSTQDSGYEYTREAIELRTSYERVRKELEKSELRDQTLTKELKAARAATHESQRELHSLKAIFAKSNAERKYLANELHEQKECNSKLEIQIARMEKPCKLIVDLDASKVENKQLLMELEKQDEIVQKSRDRDQAQRREIEALNRSIDASVHFQVHTRGSMRWRTHTCVHKLYQV